MCIFECEYKIIKHNVLLILVSLMQNMIVPYLYNLITNMLKHTKEGQQQGKQ